MSLTAKTWRRRELRQRRAGKQNKKTRANQGTPPFPIDPAEAGPNSAEKPEGRSTAASTIDWVK